MSNFTKPEIPPEHLEFAKELGKLAQKHGIQKADFSYLPNWRTEPIYHYDISGKVHIEVKTADSRGRPDLRVTINLTSEMELII